MRPGLVLLILSPVLLSQTQPTILAVTNAADFTYSVAPGSLATIFGTDLASGKENASSTPLPTTMQNAGVVVNGVQAHLIYVSPTQINFQVPYVTPEGTVQVSSVNGGFLSNSLTITVGPASIGIFKASGQHGAVQNQDNSGNSAGNPAVVGSVITVYLTGIGVTTPLLGDGMAAPSSPLSSPVGNIAATIGGVNATVQFLGLSPGFVGLGQADIVVPASLGTGDYPVSVGFNGDYSVTAFVSVKGSGSVPAPGGWLNLVSTISLEGGVGSNAQPAAGIVNGWVRTLGNTLYICGPTEFTVVDISNPAAPAIAGQFGSQDFASAGFACSLDSSGTKPFLVENLAGAQQFLVYDLSNALNPVKAADFSTPVNFVGATGVYVGNIGFFDTLSFSPGGGPDGGNLFAVDFTNLTSPALVSQLQQGASPATNLANGKADEVLVGNTLFVASSTSTATPSNGIGALDVFDVSNPASIQGVAQLGVLGSQRLLNVALSGTELLAVGNTGDYGAPNTPDPGIVGTLTITMFDVSNPSVPQMQGNVGTSYFVEGGYSAVALGGGFYAVQGNPPDTQQYGGSTGSPGTLFIVDARDPNNPVVVPYAGIQGICGMAVADGYLYVATGQGANVYKIETP